MADAEMKSIVYALHDSVMVLAAPGWESLELSFVKAPAGPMLEAIKTKGSGTAVPRAKANLRIQPQHEAQRLSEALGELVHLLAAQGKSWTPGTLTVSRQTDFADWKLLRPDGSMAYFERLPREELERLLITDSLLDLVQGTERAFEDLQSGLERKLGHVTGFAFDSAETMLRLRMPDGSMQTLPAQVVGQYLPEHYTWSWSWSDIEASEASFAAVRRVCAPEAAQDGLSALWRPHFHCDEGFAWTLASHVAVAVGARGLFRGELPDGSGVIFFAVMPPKPQ